MFFDAKIDTTKWNEQVKSLAAALGKSSGEVIKDEARLLLKMCIRLTPPKNSKQGRDAVKRDIIRAVKPFDDSFFWSPEIQFVLKQNKKAFSNEAKAEIIRKNFKGWERLEYKPWDASLHWGKRDKRGRVHDKKWSVFSDPKEVKKHIKKILPHVGRLKAGWIPAFNYLGGRASSWIEKHSTGAKGRFVDNTKDYFFRPSFEIQNFAKGAGDGELDRKVKNALRIRANAMKRRVKLILSGFSSDIASGMRAQSRSMRTADSYTAS